jgi:hypothetical protein
MLIHRSWQNLQICQQEELWKYIWDSIANAIMTKVPANWARRKLLNQCVLLVLP